MSVPARSPGPLPAWLPNLITVVRIGLIPLFVALVLLCDAAARGSGPLPLLRSAALGVLLVGGASDFLDGYMARRHGLGSQRGAMLDAVADKLAQFTILLIFAVVEGPAFWTIPWWFVGLIFFRDLALWWGWWRIRRRRGAVRIRHEAHGKVASFLIFLLLVAITAGVRDRSLEWAMWLLAVLVVVSALDYVREGWRQFRKGNSRSAEPGV